MIKSVSQIRCSVLPIAGSSTCVHFLSSLNLPPSSPILWEAWVGEGGSGWKRLSRLVCCSSSQMLDMLGPAKHRYLSLPLFLSLSLSLCLRALSVSTCIHASLQSSECCGNDWGWTAHISEAGGLRDAVIDACVWLAGWKQSVCVCVCLVRRDLLTFTCKQTGYTNPLLLLFSGLITCFLFILGPVQSGKQMIKATNADSDIKECHQCH